MCRLMVNAAEPQDQMRHYHVGDVIDVQPDGHTWTPTELADPRLRFVEMPGVVPADVVHLLESEHAQHVTRTGAFATGAPPTRGAPMLRRRRMSVDVAPGGVIAKIKGKAINPGVF